MKKFCCVFCAALAVVAVMGGDDSVRGAEGYYRKALEYFLNDDYAEAFRHLQKSAALGNAKALCALGEFYNNGLCGEKNPELAKKCFTEAEPGLLRLAEKDDAEAQWNVAFLGPENHRNEYWLERAVESFRAAAARGDAEAQVNFGTFYEHGIGVKKDLAEAVEWYRRAADRGHPEAAFFLGMSYANGRGVKLDFAEAMKWFHIAAERGYTRAEVVIAEHYEYDKKDMGEALKWYRRAAAHGNKLAQWALQYHCEHPERSRQRFISICLSQTDPKPADL